MSVPVHEAPHAETLSAQVRQATGESAFRCYQCGKCTAGCPLAEQMDFPPHQILRLLQLGGPEHEAEALGALSIWLCLTCETCAARCPQEVDIPRVMEYLRQRSLAENRVNPAARDIRVFYEAFLDTIKASGRLHEVGLVQKYKLRTGHLLQDVMLAPKLFLRGKLSVFAHSIAGQKAVARLFEATVVQPPPAGRTAEGGTAGGGCATRTAAEDHHA